MSESRGPLALRIEYLADHLTFAPQLATWHFAEWSRLFPWWTAEAALHELQGHVWRCHLPTTLVALDDGALVGSVSLIAHDLIEYPQYTPWLASLYVRRDVRRCGVGSALVERLIDESSRLPISDLFLFTTDHDLYYMRWGWAVEQRITYHGVPGTIMRRVADASDGPRLTG
ncbi:MAG: GNAT family N-acetyltransferase [Gemmatimonadaceae bacterium]